MENSQQQTANSEEKKTKQEIMQWIKAFSTAFVIFIILRMFVFEINEVVGTSMEPGFHKGNKVIVEKITYRFSRPQRGDVIVFRKPGTNSRLIKRIIAVPGDQLFAVNGQIYINGFVLDEPHVLEGESEYFSAITVENGILHVDGIKVESMPAKNDKVFADAPEGDNVIPGGYYFLLGDNRRVSQDSRIWGFLPKEKIIGKVCLRFNFIPLFVEGY